MNLSPVLVAVAGVLGLVVGSFLNVVIARVPDRRSIVQPGSSCPSCGHPIRPYDNVPVVSYLILRGRCRDCRARISPRYPLVEAGCAALLALAAARFGASWSLAVAVVLLVTLLAVAVIDAERYVIPNPILAVSALVSAVILPVGALVSGEPRRLLWAVVGGGVAGLAFLVVAVIVPKGMGMGDMKLAALLGLDLGYLGPRYVLVGFAAAFLLGGALSIALLATRRRGRKDAIPFGVFLALGGATAVFFAPQVADWYVRLSGG